MDSRSRFGDDGSGPGDITPGGRAVELYRRLHMDNEPGVIAGAVPPPATLLGLGRVTRASTASGYAVTAVDESPAMLSHGRTRTYRSRPPDGTWATARAR